MALIFAAPTKAHKDTQNTPRKGCNMHRVVVWVIPTWAHHIKEKTSPQISYQLGHNPHPPPPISWWFANEKTSSQLYQMLASRQPLDSVRHRVLAHIVSISELLLAPREIKNLKYHRTRSFNMLLFQCIYYKLLETFIEVPQNPRFKNQVCIEW